MAAIFGPTAVGKSGIALEAAQLLDAEIVSADSMQVYRGLPILTDQPSAAMLGAVRHHLIAAVDLAEEYSAGRFAREAAAAIGDINERGKLPLLVGGTGLYIRSLLGGFSFAGRADGEERAKWRELIEEQGTAAALAELSMLDPKAAQAIDSRNERRLLRALEAAVSEGPSFSEERDRLWSAQSPYLVRSFGLFEERERLYRRIDARVDQMLAGGAVEEVRSALAGEVSRTAARAIGFEDIRAYLAGKQTLVEAGQAIKQKSRRYAKRQLTWMRKMPDIARIDVAGRQVAEVAREVAARIEAGLAGHDKAPQQH